MTLLATGFLILILGMLAVWICIIFAISPPRNKRIVINHKVIGRITPSADKTLESERAKGA